jgi:Domain of unknown function (DUF6458)
LVTGIISADRNIVRAHHGLGKKRRTQVMGSGISIFLIAAGATLYFAVSKAVDGLNVGAVGVILMIVGALGLIVSLFVLVMNRNHDGRTTVVQEAAPVQTAPAVLQDGGR